MVNPVHQQLCFVTFPAFISPLYSLSSCPSETAWSLASPLKMYNTKQTNYVELGHNHISTPCVHGIGIGIGMKNILYLCRRASCSSASISWRRARCSRPLRWRRRRGRWATRGSSTASARARKSWPPASTPPRTRPTPQLGQMLLILKFTHHNSNLLF